MMKNENIKSLLVGNVFFSSAMLIDEAFIHKLPSDLDELIEKLFLLLSANSENDVKKQHELIQEIKGDSASIFAKHIFLKTTEFEYALFFEKSVDDKLSELIEALADTIAFAESNFSIQQQAN